MSQTQIFTASSQKKEGGAPGGATTAPTNEQNEPARFSTNFPIGHFNAEEATQKIKKAVGVSTSPPCFRILHSGPRLPVPFHSALVDRKCKYGSQ